MKQNRRRRPVVFRRRALRFIAAVFGLLFAFGTYFYTSGEEMKMSGPVAWQIWSVAEHRFVMAEEVLRAAHKSKFVLLGEKHDNLEHHRLQLFVLGDIVRAGNRPALVMEQLDREYNTELSAELARKGKTPESVLAAAHFDSKGWMTEGYLPLVEFAVDHDLNIVAGNFSRKDAWELVKHPDAVILPVAPEEVEKYLSDMIYASHPGAEIDEALVRGMVKAQRARDFYLAEALQKHKDTGAVLIAGAGHTDLRHGVPLYLAEKPFVIKFTEIDPSVTDPEQYVERDSKGVPQSDYIWFTHRSSEK